MVKLTLGMWFHQPLGPTEEDSLREGGVAGVPGELIGCGLVTWGIVANIGSVGDFAAAAWGGFGWQVEDMKD